MNQACRDSYLKHYNPIHSKYAARIEEVNKGIIGVLQQYMTNTLCLYTKKNNGLRYVTVSDIKEDIIKASKEGRASVSYVMHKHYYPGYRGDNVSFLTGKYYMHKGPEIPGAPCLTDALRTILPGFMIYFIEGEYDNGTLIIQI
jgi:hypothetical protein